MRDGRIYRNNQIHGRDPGRGIGKVLELLMMGVELGIVFQDHFIFQSDLLLQ